MDDEWEEVPKKRTTSKTASKERDWLGASATESSFDSLLSKGQERGKSKRELEREEEEKRKLEIRKEREIKVNLGFKLCEYHAIEFTYFHEYHFLDLWNECHHHQCHY